MSDYLIPILAASLIGGVGAFITHANGAPRWATWMTYIILTQIVVWGLL